MTDAGDQRMRNLSGQFPGPRGPKGDQGEPLSRKKSNAIVWMFLFALVVSGVNLYWTSHVVRANNQQRCGGIAQQVAIPVPVPTADNPSREWVARYSAIERQRGEQLGCHMPPPRFVTQP